MTEPHDHGTPLRVLTLNIRHGEGIDDRLDLDRTAEVLREVNADVVTLQEVDRYFHGRSEYVDQAWQLGTRLNMTAVFGADLVLPPGDEGQPYREYGNAILTRLPIFTWRVVPLPAWPGLEPRAVLQARVTWKGDPIEVWTTHLAHEDADARLDQARGISRLLSRREAPVILTGDLNDTPDSPVLQVLGESLSDAWGVSELGHVGTYDSITAKHCIDYILHTAEIRTSSVTRVDVGHASDHHGVLAGLWLR